GARRHRCRRWRTGAGPVAAAPRRGVGTSRYGSLEAARGPGRTMTSNGAADASRRVDTIENRWSMDQLMTGIRFGPWMKLLQKNRFKFSPEYAHRVAWLTGMSISSSML